jgi:hypothetical protein
MSLPQRQFEDDLSFTRHKFDIFLCLNAWIEEESQRTGRFLNTSSKADIRKGVPFHKRRAFWFHTSGGMMLFSQVEDVWQSALQTETQNHPEYNFGYSDQFFNRFSFELGETLKRFLSIIFGLNKRVEFFPLIPYAATMLLTIMEENFAFFLFNQ